MYEVPDDTHCYPGTKVLKNKLAIKDQTVLDDFEAEMTSQRATEAMPDGNLDYAHYCGIHKHLFQDVYPWAGQQRSVRISKGGSMFCYPENIRSQADKLFKELKAKDHLKGLDKAVFAKAAAHVMAEINAIHPFREGNGRSQLAFLTMLADRAGHPLDLERIDPETVMDAMIDSFGGDEKPLADIIEALIA